MIVWLPLENFEHRYTSQWARWFPEQLTQLNKLFRTVEGKQLTSEIESGSVLDIYGTNYFKCTQLATVISLLRDGIITSRDTLFFADLWYPGIEALEYISCQGGPCPKIVGILHAGSYDPSDFTYRAGMRPWAHELESAWFEIYSLVFVATQYHKDLILKNHRVDPRKIRVTGLPFYPNELDRFKSEKRTGLVFPHRLDPEKGFEEFESIRNIFPYKSVRTYDVCKTKDDYYKLLGHSKIAVSMSHQETFGIAMLEATALGCIPLVPDRLSYKELYPELLRYKSTWDLLHKVNQIRGGDKEFEEERASTAYHHKRYLGDSITRMVAELG